MPILPVTHHNQPPSLSHAHPILSHLLRFPLFFLIFQHGRGKAWNLDENAILARMWVATSEDPIVGAEQNSKTFYESLYRRFCELSPSLESCPAGKYHSHPFISVRNHFTALYADAQKFYIAMQNVRLSNPTGVTEEDTISMAIAIHVVKTDKMDYGCKSFPNQRWVHFKAWLVLREYPKWSYIAYSSDRININRFRSLDSPNASSFQQFPSEGSSYPKIDNNSTGKNVERFKVGMQKAKALRHEQTRTLAVWSMAESAKRKSDALRGKNAILVFSQASAADLPDRKQFFPP